MPKKYQNQKKNKVKEMNECKTITKQLLNLVVSFYQSASNIRLKETTCFIVNTMDTLL